VQFSNGFSLEWNRGLKDDCQPLQQKLNFGYTTLHTGKNGGLAKKIIILNHIF